MSNYWLDEPFVVSVNDTWKIVAVPIRLRELYRDYLSDNGILLWEERADMRPGYIEFGYEETTWQIVVDAVDAETKTMAQFLVDGCLGFVAIAKKQGSKAGLAFTKSALSN